MVVGVVNVDVARFHDGVGRGVIADGLIFFLRDGKIRLFLLRRLSF
jgi:hypothetical protein